MTTAKGSSETAVKTYFIELSDLSDRPNSFAQEEERSILSVIPSEETTVEEVETNYQKWIADASFILKLTPEDHEDLCSSIIEEFDKSSFAGAAT